MNRIASVFFFGIAVAVVLALDIPGKANAFVNDNDTNGRLILVGDKGISIAEGVNINTEKADQELDHDREREYDLEKSNGPDRVHRGTHDQWQDYNSIKEERIYDRDKSYDRH